MLVDLPTRRRMRAPLRRPPLDLAVLLALAPSACRAAPPAAGPQEPRGPGELVWEASEDGRRLVARGELDAGCPRLPGEAVQRYRLVNYDGVAGELLTAHLASRAFDAYLALLHERDDGTWIELGRDDDGGEGTDARLELELPFDGRYQLLVGTALPEQEGAFELALESGGELALPSRDDAGAGRYALLVGVEDYPGVESDLVGPRSDVELFRELLVGSFGFPADDVVVLADARATRHNLIRAFAEHLGRAGEGDVAVFYFSGHGLQTRGNLGLTGAADPEPDDRDEALYLADGGILLDDELGWLTDRVRARRKLVVLDSCFSGTGSRGPAGYAKRVSPEDVEGALWVPDALLVEGTVAPPTLSGARLLGEGAVDHVLLASSRSDQLSWTLPPSGEHGACSAFTFATTRVLGAAGPDDTFESLMADVRDLTVYLVADAHGEEQEPAAEGEPVASPVRAFLDGGPHATP